MAESIFQCAVHKTHTRKIPEGKRMAQYYCCGKPMIRFQVQSADAVKLKPQNQGLTQSSSQAFPIDKPQQTPEQPSKQSPAA